MALTQRSIGESLRDWRLRRRRSQLDLALHAEVSSRHLSFVETGRSQPSRELLLKLSDCLDVPIRERNVLLLAAGFAPLYAERPLSHPDLATARIAVERILTGHEPFPALAVDRHWSMIMANKTAQALIVADDPALLAPPINVFRLCLHPQGLAPRIVNYGQWRRHALGRLQRQIDLTGDPVLVALQAELATYPAPVHADSAEPDDDLGAFVVPFRLRVGDAVLSFMSTITVFGTPIDVTVSELAVEAFFPADAATAEAVRALA